MRASNLLAAADWLALMFPSPAGVATPGFRSIAAASRGLMYHGRAFRLEWADRVLDREVRIIDSTLIGNLVHSVTFYCNTTIYIIAALGTADKLPSFTTDMALVGDWQPRTSGNQTAAPEQFLLCLFQIHLFAAAIQYSLGAVLFGHKGLQTDQMVSDH